MLLPWTDSLQKTPGCRPGWWCRIRARWPRGKQNISLISLQGASCLASHLFQTLPCGPQRLCFNLLSNQFSPCPTTRCAVWALCLYVYLFLLYCCLPGPPDPVICISRSLPYSSSLQVFLVAHLLCLSSVPMHGAPKLSCIVNIIRVTPPWLGSAGFLSWCPHYMN